MALTQADIQLIREALQPAFDHIENRLEQVDKRFDQVDQRLDQVDRKLAGIDKLLDDLVQAVVEEGNERYSDHEERIQALEREVHTT